MTATDATSPTPKTAKARTSGVSAAPQPLTNSVPPSINGAPVIGQTLTAVNGTWNGVGPVTFTYQWTNDGVNIGGATAQTLALVAGMEGHNIAVKVTGTDNAAQTLTITSAAVLARLPGLSPSRRKKPPCWQSLPSTRITAGRALPMRPASRSLPAPLPIR